MQIPARVFSETMNQLNDAFWLGSRYIDPSIDSIPFVVREKVNFMQHKNTSVFFNFNVKRIANSFEVPVRSKAYSSVSDGKYF